MEVPLAFRAFWMICTAPLVLLALSPSEPEAIGTPAITSADPQRQADARDLRDIITLLLAATVGTPDVVPGEIDR